MKKSKFTQCSCCGKEIAASAKVCPACGAKVKRPIYRRAWFWILVVIVVICIMPSRKTTSKATTQPAAATVTATPVPTATPAPTATPVPETAAVEEEAAEQQPDPTPEPEPVKEEPAPTYSSEDFRKACDDYEAFIDEYVAFMQEYSKDPSNMSYLSKMLTMESSLLKWEEEMEGFEDYDLTDADALYLAQVELNCSQKLLKVVG